MEQDNRLMDYNKVADSFIRVNDEDTKKAMAKAMETIGNAEWKAGFNNEKRDQVRAILKENGVDYETKISGKLMDVNYVQTKDANGKPHDKLRVTLETEQGKTTLSVEMNEDFTQRLIPKLDTATMEHAGKNVTVIAFAKEKLGTDGKTYGDFSANLKDQDGQEIKAPDAHREKTAEIADNARSMHPDDKEERKYNRNKERKKYFIEVTKGLHNRMVERGMTQTYPGHEASLLADERGANGEQKWHSLKVYANKEGDLLATLEVTENKERVFRQSKLEVKDGKDGGLVVRGEGFGAKIGEDRKVQFFEGKEQVRGTSSYPLKPNDASLKLPAGKDRTAEALNTRLGQGKDRNVGKEV